MTSRTGDDNALYELMTTLSFWDWCKCASTISRNTQSFIRVCPFFPLVLADGVFLSNIGEPDCNNKFVKWCNDNIDLDDWAPLVHPTATISGSERMIVHIVKGKKYVGYLCGFIFKNEVDRLMFKLTFSEVLCEV